MYLYHWFLCGVVARESRNERVPVVRPFVGVRKRNQEVEGTCLPGFRCVWGMGGLRGNRRESVPVALAFLSVRKRNQEGEGTCSTGIFLTGEGYGTLVPLHKVFQWG